MLLTSAAWTARARRGAVSAAVTGLAIGLLTPALLAGDGSSAQAAPTVAAPAAQAPTVMAAVPGVPEDPTLIWTEDFENNPASVPSPGSGPSASRLVNYVSAEGTTYTTDPYWQDAVQCNGVVLSWDSNLPIPNNRPFGEPQFPPGLCSTGNYNGNYPQLNVRRLADVLGQVGAGIDGGTKAAPTNASTVTTQANHVVSEWTTSGSGSGRVVAETSPITVANAPTIAQFYSASIDIAEVSCEYQGGRNNSLIDVFLGGQKVNLAPIRACTDPAVGYYDSPVPRDLPNTPTTWGNAGTYVGAGRYHTDRGIYLTAAQLADLRVRIEDQVTVSGGNDFAFDNIRILNTTPSLAKSFSPAAVTQGEVSRLTFTVTNTSELGRKEGWSFTDNLPAGLVVAPNPDPASTCVPPQTFAPVAGAGSISVTGTIDDGIAACTLSVNVVSQDPGVYTNATSNVPTQGLNPPDDAVLTVTPRIAPSVEKTAVTPSFVPGSTVTYQVVVRNGASTAARPVSTIVGLEVDDPLPAGMNNASWTCTTTGGATCADGSGATLTDTVDVPAGASIIYTVTGTAAATATGSLTNTVTITSPTTATVPDGSGGTITVPVVNDGCGQTCTDTATILGASLSVAKSASPSTVTAAGQTVTYSFVVTNTGAATLTDVAVDDTLTPPAAPALNVTCPPGPLAAGDAKTCTAEYTVTQADMDKGRIDNSATASGLRPGATEPVVSEPSAAVVIADADAAITVTKSARPTTVAAPGEEVTYTFLVENTGNVTLTGVGVDDTLAPPAGPALSVTCPKTTLAPDETMTCTAAYTATQADFDHGTIENSATAHGTPPTGPVETSPPSTATVTTTQDADLAITKTASAAVVEKVGDVVTYTLTVTNTGTVTLTDVEVTDQFAAPADPAGAALACTIGGTAVSLPIASLAPGDRATCTIDYTVTKADLDHGVIVNTGSTTGTPPGGLTLPSTTTPPVSVTVSAPGIAIEKRADRTQVTKAGQVVNYRFVVTNTGNVPLSDVRADDQLAAPAGPALDVSCPKSTLAPGATMTCTSRYVVTQADVDHGVLSNTATATGTPPTPPGGQPGTPLTSPPSTVEISVPAGPAISLEKMAHVSPAGPATVGSTIRYTFVVTNVGNVTVTDVEVEDPRVGEVTCDETELAPGESTKCIAEKTHTVTEADAENGEVVNTAKATAVSTDGSGTVTSSPAQAVTEIESSSDTTPPPGDSDGGDLPDTGSDVPGWLTPTALLLLAAGIGLVVYSRRRAHA